MPPSHSTPNPASLDAILALLAGMPRPLSDNAGANALLEATASHPMLIKMLWDGISDKGGDPSLSKTEAAERLRDYIEFASRWARKGNHRHFIELTDAMGDLSTVDWPDAIRGLCEFVSVIGSSLSLRAA